MKVLYKKSEKVESGEPYTVLGSPLFSKQNKTK